MRTNRSGTAKTICAIKKLVCAARPLLRMDAIDEIFQKVYGSFANDWLEVAVLIEEGDFPGCGEYDNFQATLPTLKDTLRREIKMAINRL